MKIQLCETKVNQREGIIEVAFEMGLEGRELSFTDHLLCYLVF